jgi:hypothetical protein
MNALVARFPQSVMSKTALLYRIGLLILSVPACKRRDGKNTRKLVVRLACFSCAPKSARRVEQRLLNVAVQALLFAIKWTNVPMKHVITCIVEYVLLIGVGSVVVWEALSPGAHIQNISSPKRRSSSKKLKLKSNKWKMSFSRILGVLFSLMTLAALRLFSRWCQLSCHL